MSTSLIAFIEYEYKHETCSVSAEEGLFTGSKDYEFFCSIAGTRCLQSKAPLYHPRGLPENKSVPLSIALNNDVFDGLTNIGWLTLVEIKESLLQSGVMLDDLRFETQTLLAIMENLDTRLGIGKSRLVFGFEE